jgi:hypothetical protein
MLIRGGGWMIFGRPAGARKCISGAAESAEAVQKLIQRDESDEWCKLSWNRTLEEARGMSRVRLRLG